MSIGIGRNPQPITEKYSQQYYPEYVTVKHGGNVQRFSYSMIQKIYRRGENIVILLCGNIFLYAPKSAFDTDDEFAEFQKFIGEVASESK